ALGETRQERLGLAVVVCQISRGLTVRFIGRWGLRCSLDGLRCSLDRLRCSLDGVRCSLDLGIGGLVRSCCDAAFTWLLAQAFLGRLLSYRTGSGENEGERCPSNRAPRLGKKYHRGKIR